MSGVLCVFVRKYSSAFCFWHALSDHVVRQEASSAMLFYGICDVLLDFWCVVPIQSFVGFFIRKVNHSFSDVVFSVLDHYSGGLITLLEY